MQEHFGGECLRLGTEVENSQQWEGSIRAYSLWVVCKTTTARSEQWHWEKWGSITIPLLLLAISSPLRTKEGWHPSNLAIPSRFQACMGLLEVNAYMCAWAFYPVCICAYFQLQKQVFEKHSLKIHVKENSFEVSLLYQGVFFCCLMELKTGRERRALDNKSFVKQIDSLILSFHKCLLSIYYVPVPVPRDGEI